MSARQLRAFAHATMNLDLDEMIEAGVIDATCTQGNSAWTKWNNDAPMFIVTLSDKKLEALATLIATKWDHVFSIPEFNPAVMEINAQCDTPDNPTEVNHVTAPDDILSTAGTHPQNGGPAPQDIDNSRADYSAGLSGRAAS